MTEPEKLPGPLVRCFLEIDGVAVDPAGPWYMVPDEQQADIQEVQDWSGWQAIGAVTDEIPPAFRRVSHSPGRPVNRPLTCTH
jgi:hypothetical protein